MNFKNYNIPLIIVIAIITLTVLMLCSWAYGELAIKKPLAQKLVSINGVNHFEAKNQNGELIMEVELQSIQDLKETYTKIDKTIADLANKGDLYSISIIDSPNEKLLAAWEDIQYAAFQAISNGDFISLHTSIEDSKGFDANLKYKISIDENLLFIQIHDGDYFLYRVLKRS